MEVQFVAAGFLVAALVAMCGVGGGSLMTPLLVLGFGVPPAVAIGTDLLYVVVAKAAALGIYARRRDVQWDAAIQLLRGSLPAAVLCLGVVAWLGNRSGLGDVLNITVGLALGLTAASLLWRGRLRAWAGGRGAAGLVHRHRGLLLSVLGALLGALVTFSSIGAGALGMAILVALLPPLPARRLVGTDLAQALPLGLAAGMGYLLLGHVDAHLLVNLLIGTFPGVLAGAWLSGKLPEPIMRGGLALVLTGLAVQLVLR